MVRSAPFATTKFDMIELEEPVPRDRLSSPAVIRVGRGRDRASLVFDRSRGFCQLPMLATVLTRVSEMLVQLAGFLSDCRFTKRYGVEYQGRTTSS